jgi:hypothetical protein
MIPRQAVERLLFEGIDRSPLRSLPLKSDKIADPWVLGDMQGLRERLQRNTEH